jgi:hypothetical protein
MRIYILGLVVKKVNQLYYFRLPLECLPQIPRASG